MTEPTGTDPGGQDFDWLLSDFVERVPGVAHAVVVSADGLPMARSTEVPADRADQLAAITSGLNSLTSGASRVFQGGPVEQTVIEMRHGTFLVTAIARGAALAVLTAPTSDMGLVSYEMALLVERVGRGMTPASRTPQETGQH